jgi:hypothetical protein
MKYTIYITPEGSINWTDKMPEEPKLMFTPVDQYAEKRLAYEKSIELAKAESIPFEDQSVEHTTAMLDIKPCFWKRDTIYPIELDADIHTTHQSRFKRWHDEQWTDWVDISILEYERSIEMGVFETRKVAKIIPKKAEESEDELWKFILEAHCEEYYYAGTDEEKIIIAKLKDAFQIKRKPL